MDEGALVLDPHKTIVMKNTYHIQGHHGVHLDCPVEVSKDDRDGEEETVDRIADVVAHELDELADDDPDAQRNRGSTGEDLAIGGSGASAQPDQQ